MTGNGQDAHCQQSKEVDDLKEKWEKETDDIT